MKHLLYIILFILGIFCYQPSVVAQQATGNIVVGKVFSKQEGEMIGVSVREVDATNRVISGTVTDVNGEFSLRIKNPKNKLVFSYLGYKDQTLQIGTKQNFNVEMKDSETMMEEVVITAQKKTRAGMMDIPDREMPMAVQTLKANFEELSVASIDEALQGQIAGLDIVANSGDVGAGSAMRLRGTTSINANVNPLIVVNDAIFNADNSDSFDFVNANNESFANLLSINVDDIESITVLKDGASTAIYGSKGANGVISIRTKRGHRGKPRLQYTFRFSEDWQPQGFKMLNGDEYTMFLKEAYYNPKQSDSNSNIKELNYIQNDATFPDWRMYDNNTDWVDAVKTTGITNDHYLTLSGGGEKARFYLSAGYYNKTGSIIGQELERLTSRMNLDYSVSDRIRFTAELAVTYSDEDKNYTGLLDIAYKKMPNLGIYKEDANGNPTKEYYAVPQDMSSQLDDQKGLLNPVAVANLAVNNVKSYRLIPNFTLEYDILPYTNDQKLRLKTFVSFDISNNSSYSFFPKELTSAKWTDESINKANRGDSKSNSTDTDISLSWTPRIQNLKHSLNMVAAMQIRGGESSRQSEESYGMPEGVISPSTGSYVLNMGSGTNTWHELAGKFFTYYSYSSKYNLGFSFRYQGSSKFGNERKFGKFGGLSFRWNIIDENFMKPTKNWMSMLALRISGGINGNEPRDEYLHYSRYESWSSYLGGSTMRPVSIRLDNLRWETTKDVNAGMDLGFFDDVFTANFNYYDKRTSDLLQRDINLPYTSGYPTYTWQNVGKTRNEGWELYLNFNRFIKAGKFSADFKLNFANNKNTVEELSDIVLSKNNGNYDFNNGTYMSRLQLGNSLGSIYGFRYKGVYQYSVDNPDLVASNYTLGTSPVTRGPSGNVILDNEGKPVPMYFAYGTPSELAFQGGDAIYEDINHDGNINELDIVYLGNSNPKLNGGMGFTLRYDRLSLNAFSVFRYGNKIVNAARMNAENMYGNNNQSRAVNWRWRKEGDLTDIPRALNKSGKNFLGSDRYVEDGSFWRIQYLSLNYSVPEKFLSKISLSSASLFLTVYNLYCFTNYSGVDPEVGYGSWGVSKDNSQTPRSKSFTMGISVKF